MYPSEQHSIEASNELYPSLHDLHILDSILSLYVPAKQGRHLSAS